MDFAHYYHHDEAVPHTYQSTPHTMSLPNMIPHQQLVGNDLLPSPTIEQQNDEHNASALEDAEDMDTASRPRLTQEQINVLEEHFRHQPKPNTDIKKQLAGEIGLSLQRVNVRRLSERR